MGAPDQGVRLRKGKREPSEGVWTAELFYSLTEAPYLVGAFLATEAKAKERVERMFHIEYKWEEAHTDRIVAASFQGFDPSGTIEGYIRLICWEMA